MTVDNDAISIVVRLAAVATLSAVAAALESPAARSLAAQRVRIAILGTFAGVALAGFLAGPMGPFGGQRHPRSSSDDAICTDRPLTVLACARDHDMRARW